MLSVAGLTFDGDISLLGGLDKGVIIYLGELVRDYG